MPSSHLFADRAASPGREAIDTLDAHRRYHEAKRLSRKGKSCSPENRLIGIMKMRHILINMLDISFLCEPIQQITQRATSGDMRDADTLVKGRNKTCDPSQREHSRLTGGPSAWLGATAKNTFVDTNSSLTHFSVRKNAMTALGASAGMGRADPQSGPVQVRGRPGFFHYNAKWIVAEPGCIAGLSTSNYINRLDVFENALNKPRSTLEMPERTASTRLSDYVNRVLGASASDGELGAHILITRGLPVETGAGLARLLDARERKVDRSYRQYGGRLPRVGTHIIVSFPYGLSPEAAAAAAWGHARLISDTLRVPLEGQVHNKGGQPDHLHLIMGTRTVINGRLGKKCRALDGVSQKFDGAMHVEGDRQLGATMEGLRADWAERMRIASGDGTIDHRSYARRGLNVTPVTHVPRSEIEYQKRRASKAWRKARQRELDARASALKTVPDASSSLSTDVDIPKLPPPDTRGEDVLKDRIPPVITRSVPEVSISRPPARPHLHDALPADHVRQGGVVWLGVPPRPAGLRLP